MTKIQASCTQCLHLFDAAAHICIIRMNKRVVLYGTCNIYECIYACTWSSTTSSIYIYIYITTGLYLFLSAESVRRHEHSAKTGLHIALNPQRSWRGGGRQTKGTKTSGKRRTVQLGCARARAAQYVTVQDGRPFLNG